MEDESSIKFIRLKTGEDLIAEVLYIKDDDVETEHYCLFKPLKVIYMMSSAMATNGPGYGGSRIVVSLLPWIMPDLVTETEFFLDPFDILLISNPTPSVISYYLEFHKANLVEEPDVDLSDTGETIDMTNAEGVIMLNKLLESRSQT